MESALVVFIGCGLLLDESAGSDSARSGDVENVRARREVAEAHSERIEVAEINVEVAEIIIDGKNKSAVESVDAECLNALGRSDGEMVADRIREKSHLRVRTSLSDRGRELRTTDLDDGRMVVVEVVWTRGEVTDDEISVIRAAPAPDKVEVVVVAVAVAHKDMAAVRAACAIHERSSVVEFALKDREPLLIRIVLLLDIDDAVRIAEIALHGRDHIT